MVRGNSGDATIVKRSIRACAFVQLISGARGWPVLLLWMFSPSAKVVRVLAHLLKTLMTTLTVIIFIKSRCFQEAEVFEAIF